MVVDSARFVDVCTRTFSFCNSTATMKALVVIVNQAEAERVQQAVFNVEGLCIVAL